MLYKKIRSVIKSFLIRCLVFCPLNKRSIVFNNFFGDGFCDNPSYIALKIHELNKRIKLYWICRDSSLKFPVFITPVFMGSFKEAYVLSTAKMRVSNIRNYFPIKIKKNQFYLQTWHGSFRVKKCEAECENMLSADYIKSAKYDGSICTAILSSNSEMDETYKKFFWLNERCEILRFGTPRSDFVINNLNNTQLIESLRAKLGIFLDDFVVCYAPTFRDDGEMPYVIDFQKMKKMFEYKMNKKCKVIVRFHPNVDEKGIVTFCDCIIDGNKNIDMSELVLISDLLITDYSSSIYEFLLAEKPIILYQPDFEKYNSQRGLINSFINLPFFTARSINGLFKLISNFNYESSKTISICYKSNMLIYDDGNASQNVAKWIIDKLS